LICYVLNLERHQARLRSFLQQFDSGDLTASEPRRFRAVDAASVWRHARALVYEPVLARLAAVKRRGLVRRPTSDIRHHVHQPSGSRP